jgi:hypothetical protein
VKNKDVQTKKVWKPKINSKQKTHTPLRISSHGDWYLNNGFPNHMTEDKRNPKRSYSEGCVTFGDGVKGRTKGIIKLAGSSSSCLDDVLLVEGLTTNLISINQLCEKALNVHFNNLECTILKDQEVVMKGTKSKDKCYQWTPQNNSPEIAFLSAKEKKISRCPTRCYNICTTDMKWKQLWLEVLECLSVFTRPTACNRHYRGNVQIKVTLIICT